MKKHKFIIQSRTIEDRINRPSKTTLVGICHEIADVEGHPLKITIETGRFDVAESLFIGATLEIEL